MGEASAIGSSKIQESNATEGKEEKEDNSLRTGLYSPLLRQLRAVA